MEDVDSVSRTICQPPFVGILARVSHSCAGEVPPACHEHGAYLTLQNEGGKLVSVDPVQLVQHGHGTHDPPAVANVFFLLWSAVEAAILALSLAEPCAEPILVDQVESAGNGQGSDTGEDLASVGFGARARAIATVEIGTRLDVGNGLVDVYQMQQAHQGEGVEGAIQEARVVLAPFIASKGARDGVLETRDDWW